MIIATIGYSRDLVGGNITYQSSFNKLISQFNKKVKKFEFIHITISKNKNVKENQYKIKFIDKIKIIVNTSTTLTLVFNKIPFHKMGFERYLSKKNVNLIIFTSPNELALAIINKTFITTIWDLAHREYPYVEEFSSYFRFNLREIYYQYSINKSFCLIVDSKETALKIEKIYGKDLADICVIGLPLFIDHKAKKTIEFNNLNPYVIYPANFWKHKNHIFLLKCFALVVNKVRNAKLVLVGEPKNNYIEIKKMIKKLKLEKNVIIKSNLEYDSVIELVRNSRGLIYPSILGPTNYPPLEANAVGVKVLLSDSNKAIKLNRNIIKISNFDQDNWTKQIIKLFKTNQNKYISSKNLIDTNIIKLKDKIIDYSKINEYII